MPGSRRATIVSTRPQLHKTLATILIAIALPAQATENRITHQSEPKITFGGGCDGENALEILDVYTEARTDYEEAASIKAGKIAHNVVAFVRPPERLRYSIRLRWRNENGNGTMADSGKLTEEESASGWIFWRFSLPGTYELDWSLKNGRCKVKVNTAFTVD